MFWTLKRIWRAAYKAVKMPMTRLHSSNWGAYDHAHVCIAARLLEPDDFHTICTCSKEDVEHCDACDDCGFMMTVCFDTVGGVQKEISLYTRGKEWCP